MKRLLQLGLLLAVLCSAPAAWAQVTFVAKGTMQGTTTTTDAQAALPAGTTANDILIVSCFVRNTGDTLDVANYTQIAQIDTSTGSHSWWWKRHDGSEGTATCNKSASADSSAIQFAFRGITTSGDPWNVLGTPEEDSPAASFTVTGVTTTAAGSMVLVLSDYEDDDLASFAATGTDPSAYTANYTEVTTSTSDSALSIAYEIRSAAGGTGTITLDYNGNGSDQFATLVLAFTPAPAPCLATDYGNGFTCVQDGMWGASTNGTGGTVTFGSAASAGNNVIVAASFCQSSDCTSTPTATFTFTNGAGDTPTAPTTPCRNATSSGSFVYRYCATIFANVSATTTFTCTSSASVYYIRCKVVEVAGGDTSSPWDGDTAIGATSGAQTSLSVSYTSSGTVFNYGAISTLGATAISPGSGFTEIREGCSTGTCGNGNQHEARGVTSGSNPCSWTFASDQAIGLCLGMKTATGGSPTAPPTLMMMGVGD